MKKINLSGITKEAVVGILVQCIALINAISQMFGQDFAIPIDSTSISKTVSVCALILVTGYNTYKNRNITKASQIGQSVTDMVKNGEILADEIEDMIETVKNANKKKK